MLFPGMDLDWILDWTWTGEMDHLITLQLNAKHLSL